MRVDQFRNQQFLNFLLCILIMQETCYWFLPASRHNFVATYLKCTVW